MFRNHSWLALGACVCFFATTAHAQSKGPLEDRSLGPRAEQIAARTLLEKRLGVSIKVRWDPASGTPASVRFQPNVRVSDDPEDAARTLLNRMARLYGIRKFGAPMAYGIELALLEIKKQGPWTVVRFEQLVGKVPVDESHVKVVLSREGSTLLGVSVSGRLYRDLPTGLGPAPTTTLPRCPPGFRWPEGCLPSSRLLITPRGGTWTYAFELEALDSKTEQRWRVIVDREGKELGRVLGWNQAFSVHGSVFPDTPSDARKLVRLPDLFATGRGSASQLVGAGLAGKYEKVLQRAGPHRLARRGGRLVLEYPLGDARSTEVNLYYQLTRSRRWLDRYRDLLGGAHLLPVTAHIRDEMNNAYAKRNDLVAHGQVGRQEMFFGQVAGVSLARDASTVIHERAHLLLYALGFSPRSDQGHGIHEGYADYISAIVRGNPQILRSVPVVSRDLSVRKVWPGDGEGDHHRTGWIYGGALWDARGELGAKMDRVALAAVPLLSGTLLEGRDAALEADRRLYGGAHAQTITRHFKNHGIAEGGGEPPVIEVNPKGDLALEPGEERTVELVASDPDGEEVALAVSDLSIAQIVGEPTRGKRASMTLRLTNDPAYGGLNHIHVTATDADGETGSHTLRVQVLTVDAHESQVTYRVAPGETRRVPLTDLVPESQRSAYAEGSFWLAGRVSGGAYLSGGKLVIQPGKGDVGRHRFTLRGAPAGDRQVADRLEVEVEVLVGEGPEVFVSDTDGHAVPPGRDLTVYAGSALEVNVAAFARVGQEPFGVQVAPTTVRQVSLELVQRPRGVTYKPGIRRPEYVGGRLRIRARARSQPHTFTVALRARFAQKGVPARSRTRTLRVHVLPVVNLPPELWLNPPGQPYFKGRVALEAGKAELEFEARDPERGQVEVRVEGNRRDLKVEIVSAQAGAAGGPLARRSPLRIGGALSRSDRMQGKLVFTWLKKAELPEPELKPTERYLTTVTVRALDAEGLSTLRVVKVFARSAPLEGAAGAKPHTLAEKRSGKPADPKEGAVRKLDRLLGS